MEKDKQFWDVPKRWKVIYDWSLETWKGDKSRDRVW